MAKRASGKQAFEVVRLIGRRRKAAAGFAGVEEDWRKGRECFLFVSPHDDDVVLGGALTIQAALAEGAAVHVAIATDGSMGYCDLADMERISYIRRVETYASYQSLGLATRQIHWLGFPDCRLTLYQGRRRAGSPEDKPQSFGYTGLQNAFTELLRRVRPTRVFMPTAADLHPDHRLVYQEMMISVFHAAGGIWPELGEPLPAVPVVYDLAIYCDFPSPPTHRVTANAQAFRRKLDAITTFASQKQIGSLVRAIEQSGPQECLRRADLVPYDSRCYNALFGKSKIKAEKPAKAPKAAKAPAKPERPKPTKKAGKGRR